MKLNTDNGFPHVYLSERNLRTLLAKLDEPHSARSLYIENDDGDDVALMVTAQHDDAHYGDRLPGRVSDTTERALA